MRLFLMREFLRLFFWGGGIFLFCFFSERKVCWVWGAGSTFFFFSEGFLLRGILEQSFLAWPSLLSLLFKFTAVSINSSVCLGVIFVDEIEAGAVLLSFRALFVWFVVSFVVSTVVVSLVSFYIVSFVVMEGVIIFVYLDPVTFLVGLVFVFVFNGRVDVFICCVVSLLRPSEDWLSLNGRVVFNSNSSAACPLPPPSFVCLDCKRCPEYFESLPGTSSFYVLSRRRCEVVSRFPLFRNYLGRRPSYLLGGWPRRCLWSHVLYVCPYNQAVAGRTLS